MHGEVSSEQGANGMNVRDVTFRIRDGEVAAGDIEPGEDVSADTEPTPADPDQVAE
jgi:hypothetical protein